MKKINSFTDLIVWKKGHIFVLDIYKITKRFPKEEQFGLAAQIRRAAVSITSNIAEGFRRRGKKEKERFYNIANSSLCEVQNQLLIARDVKYVDNMTFQKLAKQSIEVSKLIVGASKALYRR